MVRTLLRAGLLAFTLMASALGVAAQSSDTLHDQLWASVRDSGDVLALETFLDAFPESAFRQTALNLIAGLNGTPVEPTVPQGTPDADACDVLAAHPGDHRRTYEPGVPFAQIQQDPQTAIDACIALVRDDPTGRVAFQLSRAYAANSDEPNRLYWLQLAADRGWERAQFRLAYMRAGDESLGRDARLQAVDALEQLGLIYPFAYVEAGLALRFGLGGTNQHRARILRLFDRAAAFEDPSAFYELARYARSEYYNATVLEQLNLLTHLIEIDHKTVWAKDRLAQIILEVLDAYRADDMSKANELATASRVGLGADGTLTGSEMLRMIDWSTEAIATSENYERLPNEQRIDILRNLIYAYARSFPAPVLTAQATPAEASALTSGSDPRMQRMWDDFCTVASLFDDPNTTIRAQVACDAFRDAFDKSVYPNLMAGHLAGIERARRLDRIKTHLTETMGVENDMRNCIVTDNLRRDAGQIQIDVINTCPFDLVVGVAGHTDEGASRQTYGQSLGRGVIAPNATSSYGIAVADVTRFDPALLPYISITACDDALFLPACRPTTAKAYMDDTAGNGPHVTAAASWRTAQTAYDRAHEAAVLGVVADTTELPPPDTTAGQSTSGGRQIRASDFSGWYQFIGDVRLGIPEDQCALIVAARPSLTQARAYIADFQNTDQWFWKIFESENGWFAISASLVLADEASDAVNKLIADEVIPADSYCKGPDGFVKRHL